MAVVGWVDQATLKADWWDAPEDARLTFLLRVAHQVCLAYAPPLAEGAQVPESWALAQELQVKHLYARDKSGNRDTMGPDGFSVSTFPLVLEARSLIRPKASPFGMLL